MFNRNNLPDQKTFIALSEQDKLKYLIFLASLAPSSHNTQPWLFKCAGQNIELFADWHRKLAASDTTGRELYISLGAALGNLLMTAEALGLNFGINLNSAPTSDSGPIAVISFAGLSPSRYDSARIKAITTRHCNRFNYDNRPVSQQTMQKIIGIASADVRASVIEGESQKKTARIIVKLATVDAFLDKGFTDELSLWIKPSLKKYNDGMPGYNLGIPWIFSFFIPWAIKHLPMGRSQASTTDSMLKASQAFMVLSTKDDNEAAWLKCGIIFERMAVEAEIENVQIAVLAAPIEIGNYYRQLQDLLKISERPQIFFRLGYCTKIPPFAPRLPLKQIVL